MTQDLDDEFDRLLQERRNGKGKATKATKTRSPDDGSAARPVKQRRSAGDAGHDLVPTPTPAQVAHNGAKPSAAALSHGYKGVRPPPFVPDPRTLAHHPRRHAPGDLKSGDSVWYRNERYFISQAPTDWDTTSFVMICDAPVRPGTFTHRDSISFCVHADLLELAPIRNTIFHDQPTKQKVEVEAKKKELGITDIGDDIGELLRGKSVDDTYAIAAKYLHVPKAELQAKYAHLNPGQQRMICGNKMRAYLKKGGK